MVFGPSPSGELPKKTISIEDSMGESNTVLYARLRELSGKRYKNNERYKIIADFLFAPVIARLIEDNNRIYKVKLCESEMDSNIYALKLQYERDKKPGFLNRLVNFFMPTYTTGVKVWHNGQLYVCEYYKHSFFSLCEGVKTEYDNKLKNTFGCDFVVVCRAK